MEMSWFAPSSPPLRRDIQERVWKRVLVPLDGSEESRWTVLRARHILQRPGIAVTLLRVIECRADRANDLSYQMDSRHLPACKELAEVRAGFTDPSMEVSTDVRFGDPATEILREIAEVNHDVVLMNANGRSGFEQALLGRVAQRVLHASTIPLLLFRPRRGSNGALFNPSASEESRFERTLVALDGSTAAEEIVPLAEQMARTLGSELRLFRAVHSGGPKEGARRLLAEEYLRAWESSLARRGVTSQVNVQTGNVAEGALSVIRERNIDSIALSTHARNGLGRAVYGSVMWDLMAASDLPILTVCHTRQRRSIPALAVEHRHVRVGGSGLP